MKVPKTFNPEPFLKNPAIPPPHAFPSFALKAMVSNTQTQEAAEGCHLLILILEHKLPRSQIKGSQPAAASTEGACLDRSPEDGRGF
ncbi:hypothetical protein ACYZUA_22760 [Pseudomonas sp. LS2P72]